MMSGQRVGNGRAPGERLESEITAGSGTRTVALLGMRGPERMRVRSGTRSSIRSPHGWPAHPVSVTMERMIDVNDPATASVRLSDAEREEAVLVLGVFVSEGRLSEAELAERSAAVRAATTRGDLRPLFADLPKPPAHPLRPSSQQQPPVLTNGPVWGAPDPSTTKPSFEEPARPAPTGSSAGAAGAVARTGGGSAEVAGSAESRSGSGSGSTEVEPAHSPSWRAGVVGATPVIATGLFFLTGFAGGWQGAWLWFLAVPAVSAIVYGGAKPPKKPKR